MDANQTSQSQQPNPTPTPVNPSHNSKLIQVIFGVAAVIAIAIGAYLLGTKQSQPVVQNKISPTPLPAKASATEGDPTANWKTYDGVYPIHFLYPKNLKLSEGDADFFSIIRLWNPLGDDGDNEFSISMLNESSLYYRSAAQLVQEKQQEGFTKEKDLYVDGILASQLKGIATPSTFTAQRMTNQIILQVDGTVYSITNWRAGENDEIFDQILSTFKFTDQLSSKNLKDACEEKGGKWLETYKECEGFDRSSCASLGGKFNDCDSACRHDPQAELCIPVCVVVCKF